MENEMTKSEEKTHDMDKYLNQLNVSYQLRDPVLVPVIQNLELPAGSRGLDAGCGTGYYALKLARETGSSGQVTGLDLSPEFVAYAKDTAEKSEQSEQISFKEGDIGNLPFENDAFDWIWSLDCAG